MFSIFTSSLGRSSFHSWPKRMLSWEGFCDFFSHSMYVLGQWLRISWIFMSLFSHVATNSHQPLWGFIKDVVPKASLRNLRSTGTWWDKEIRVIFWAEIGVISRNQPDETSCLLECPVSIIPAQTTLHTHTYWQNERFLTHYCSLDLLTGINGLYAFVCSDTVKNYVFREILNQRGK